mmetsp:Transcript_36471/g.79825  ORF Transcript_36471/g.79825 Transcript_36471/m.79825 type:complete len:216 (+) Transcript_36471:186-833(+)
MEANARTRCSRYSVRGPPPGGGAARKLGFGVGLPRSHVLHDALLVEAQGNHDGSMTMSSRRFHSHVPGARLISLSSHEGRVPLIVSLHSYMQACRLVVLGLFSATWPWPIPCRIPCQKSTPAGFSGSWPSFTAMKTLSRLIPCRAIALYTHPPTMKRVSRNWCPQTSCSQPPSINLERLSGRASSFLRVDSYCSKLCDPGSLTHGLCLVFQWILR